MKKNKMKEEGDKLMEVKDILTLSDDNEYLIAGKATYEHKVYLYLVDINNNKNLFV